MLKSDAAIETSRIVTYSRAQQQSVDDGREHPAPDAAHVGLVFSATALRPSSPYAEPVVRVDYVHRPNEARANDSVGQQVRTSSIVSSSATR